MCGQNWEIWTERCPWSCDGMANWEYMYSRLVGSVYHVCSGSHSSSLPPVTLPLPRLLCFGAWLRAFRPAVPSASSLSFFTTLCPSAAHMASASSRSWGMKQKSTAVTDKIVIATSDRLQLRVILCPCSFWGNILKPVIFCWPTESPIDWGRILQPSTSRSLNFCFPTLT